MIRSVIATALSELGQSVTRPRIAIYEALADSGPIALPQLARITANELDRATVYRTVGLFKELGFIHSVTRGHEQLIELSDRFDTHHHHLVCQHCGQSISFTDSGTERRLELLARGYGFELNAHQIELTGVCEDCRLPRSQSMQSRTRS